MQSMLLIVLRSLHTKKRIGLDPYYRQTREGMARDARDSHGTFRSVQRKATGPFNTIWDVPPYTNSPAFTGYT